MAASNRFIARRRAFAASFTLVSVAAAAAFAQAPPPTAPPTTRPPAQPSGPALPPSAAPGGRPGAGPVAAPGQPQRRPGGTPVEERPEGLRPRPIPPKTAVAGGPAIWFDVLDYDFGPMTNAETRKCKFTYFNIGDAPLTVKDVVPACGCTQPRFERNKTLQPGESAVVEVDFTPPTGGHQAKALHVVSDAKNVPEVYNIRVIGEVEAVLSFDPKTYEFGELKLGEPHEAIFEIKADADSTFFDSVTSRSDMVTASFVDPAPRKGKATMKVTINPKAEWGYFRQGVVQIVTKGKLENGQEVTKTLPLRLTATIVDNVRASDYVIQCGDINFGQAFHGESSVTSVDGAPFEIVDAKIEPMASTNKGVADFQSTLKVVPLTDPATPGYKIIVDGVAGSKSGFISGAVTFGTKGRDGAVVKRSLGLNGHIDEPGARRPGLPRPAPAAGGAGRPAATPPAAPAATPPATPRNPPPAAPPAGR
ncbi:MAG: DUF1573 domain-containing protein [Phycisphaerales bacterium]